MPGLLQTAAYARAVTVAANPFVTDEYIEEKVTARLERARILEDATRPEYWVILHENVLRVPVGGGEAMAAQLDRIARLMRERHVMVTVLPYAAGAHPCMGGMLTLMEFEDAPPVAYTETSFSGTLVDNPGVPGMVPVRDSKRTDGPVVLVGPEAWRAFIREVGAAGSQA